MSDFLDILHIKDEEVLTATYYPKRPKTPNDTGEPFAYDIVAEPRSNYGNIISNLNGVLSYQTIKTNDFANFKVKGYCVTQEGGLWQIEEITKQLITSDNKQALRNIKQIETEYTLRMIEVDNPWGLE